MRCLLPILLALSLAACAGGAPTRYAPADGSGRGWSEMKIESDRFRIRFAAGGDTSFREAEDYALRRAAEITLREGGDWFLVVTRAREGNDRDPVDVGGSFSQTWGSGGFRASGVGVGVRIDGSAGEKEVMLEILVRSGERPADANAYDARAVLTYAPD